MLLFEVEKQKMKRLDAVEPATDSEQYLKAKFTCDDADWNGKAKTAYFRLGDAVYKALLDSNNECVVPSEVLIRSESKYARTQGSRIFVSLVGEYSTVRITTNEVQVDLDASGYADAEEPKKPTESEYQQILTQYANNEAAINEAKAECETARADLVGVKNIFANAIKGNLSGAVVYVDDVSPVEHEPVVKVHSKNLCVLTNAIRNPARLSYDESTQTFTVLEAGMVQHIKTFDTPYPAGTKIAVTLKIESGQIHGTLSFGGYHSNPNGVSDWQGYVTAEADVDLTGKTYTTVFTSTDTITDIVLFVDGAATVNTPIVLKAQFELGDTATEYEPYVDPSTMTVRRCGKNIYKVVAKTQTINGVTFTVNNDGSVTANGTASKATFFSLGNLKIIPNETYFISGSPAGSGFDTYMLYVHNNTTGADIYDLGEGKVFTGKAGDLGLTIVIYANNTVNNLTFYPMVVYGEESVPFESYNGSEHTPSADGTVEGITSLSPNMTILTDTEGAIVECEYIKDTNKVLANFELSGGASVTKDGTVVSPNADFAEVAEWADGNPDNEDRSGYFVCANVPLDRIVMKKATSIDDVKGVTIKNPAFAGNYTKEKLDSNGNLLPKYSYVAIIGFVPVIDNGTCTVGGRCMPDDNGCAIPSSNSMGYQVVNRIDENRVLIIIEPNGDMVQRIKTKINELQETIEGIQTGEGGVIVVDQTYKPESPNAQSGKAVAEAVDNVYPFVQDKFSDTVMISQTLGIDGVTGKYFIFDEYENVYEETYADNFEVGFNRIVGNNKVDVPVVVGAPTKRNHSATKEYVDGLVGDIETALDNIIAIQNELIGGGSV